MPQHQSCTHLPKGTKDTSFTVPRSHWPLSWLSSSYSVRSKHVRGSPRTRHLGTEFSRFSHGSWHGNTSSTSLMRRALIDVAPGSGHGNCWNVHSGWKNIRRYLCKIHGFLYLPNHRDRHTLSPTNHAYNICLRLFACTHLGGMTMRCDTQHIVPQCTEIEYNDGLQQQWLYSTRARDAGLCNDWFCWPKKAVQILIPWNLLSSDF